MNIDTDAGTYTIEIHQDPDPMHPLKNWDHEGMAFLVEYSGYGGRWDTDVDTLADAGQAGTVLRELLDQHGHDCDEVGRRFVKWSAIAGSPWILAMGGQSASQSEYYRYVVLANGSEFPDPGKAIVDTMSEYSIYAEGNVVGFVVKSPNDDIVASVWGFYDEREAIAVAMDEIEHDVKVRLSAANLIGSGLVGLI